MEDTQLIKRIRDKDENAIELLMKKYSKLLWAISIAILGKDANAHDVEEIVSETFLRLWEFPDKYQPAKGSLKNYLALIARSLSINKVQREKKHYILDDNFSLADIRQSENGEYFFSEVFSLIISLEEPMKEVCLQRFIFEKTPEIISKELRIPKKTVNNYLYRGKKILKQELADYRMNMGG